MRVLIFPFLPSRPEEWALIPQSALLRQPERELRAHHPLQPLNCHFDGNKRESLPVFGDRLELRV
ncbi:hypothetical protein [uncultured Bartonella sp.]|uniref:hypothetical protein n=1 Tax=uncultured Bartonella sp. TaxID=104108 RepID=UPI0026231A64|nr:hypothetical protein [uncultured Bartonella sp.]